jgi:SAM-dependent methyltransferase
LPGSAEPVPISVWPTAQQPPARQRIGRYHPGSTAHPAKMAPAIARQVITGYTAPGDWVIDPMCGIGTSLVEAVHLGRHAVGVEYEPRWAQLARANLSLAAKQGATGTGQVITGDARHLLSLVPRDLVGRVALVLTSPPYGASVHGQVHAQPGRGVAKRDYRYSRNRANLAHQPTRVLLDAFATILTCCVQLLRPGGVVAVTVRPFRRDGELVDLPTAVLAAGERAGLVPYERNVALLVGLRGDRLVPRTSFFQLEHVRRARARGCPLHVIAHEDVIVFRRAPR